MYKIAIQTQINAERLKHVKNSRQNSRRKSSSSHIHVPCLPLHPSPLATGIVPCTLPGNFFITRRRHLFALPLQAHTPVPCIIIPLEAPTPSPVIILGHRIPRRPIRSQFGLSLLIRKLHQRLLLLLLLALLLYLLRAEAES